MEEIGVYIFSRHSYEFNNFCDSIEKYNFFIDNDEKSITFCRMTLLVINHNLDKSQWRDFCIILQDLVKENYSDTEIKKLDEYKILRTYINKFHIGSDITITKGESPDFKISLPNGICIGVEVTKLIDGTGAVINKISQDCFGRGKTTKEILCHAQKKYPKISKEIKIDNLKNGNAITYISPKYTRNVTKEHINYANQIMQKYLMFQEWSKKENFNNRIILCASYSPISITNKRDFDEIGAELFKHKYSMKCQAVIYSIFDGFEDCWGIINLENNEIVVNIH